jgi:hypothetical protein
MHGDDGRAKKTTFYLVHHPFKCAIRPRLGGTGALFAAENNVAVQSNLPPAHELQPDPRIGIVAAVMTMSPNRPTVGSPRQDGPVPTPRSLDP